MARNAPQRTGSVIENGMVVDRKLRAEISRRSRTIGAKLGNDPKSAHQPLGSVALPDGTQRKVWQAHAVDAVVLDPKGNTVVIERGGHGPGKGKKATPGGFIDTTKGGVESARAAVLRELAEESGVSGKAVEGAKIKPLGDRKYGRSFDIREAANDIANTPIKKGDLFTVSTRGFKIETANPLTAVKAGSDARRAAILPAASLKSAEFGVKDHFAMIRKATAPRSSGRGRAASASTSVSARPTAKGDPVARKAAASAGVKPVSGIEARQSAERVGRASEARARSLQRPSAAPVTDPARAASLRRAVRSPEGQAALAKLKTSLQETSTGLRSISDGLKGSGPASAPAAARPTATSTFQSPHLDRPTTIPGQSLGMGLPTSTQRPWGVSNAMAAAGTTYRAANIALPGAASIAEGVRAYRAARAQQRSISQATVEGAQAAAPGAALAASPAIAKGAGHIASGAFEAAKVAASGIGLFDYVFLNMMHAKIAGVAAATGVAAKGIEIAAKVGSRVALPAYAGYQAYQGYKEDGWRGAGRGAVTALDPTELATVLGAKSGIGRAIYDKHLGKAGEANPYKDAWTDKNGVRKVRRDFSVRAN